MQNNTTANCTTVQQMLTLSQRQCLHLFTQNMQVFWDASPLQNTNVYFRHFVIAIKAELHTVIFPVEGGVFSFIYYRKNTRVIN